MAKPDLRTEVYLHFPTPLYRKDVALEEARAMRDTNRRIAWSIEVEGLERALRTGTYIVKPGHRVSSVEGTSQDTTEPKLGHYSRAQLARRREKRDNLALRLNRVRPQSANGVV